MNRRTRLHFAPHHTRSTMLRLLALALMLCLSMTAGCKDDGQGGGATSNLLCDAIATTALSGPPLTRLAVTGLTGADDSTDWVTARDDEGRSYPTALYGNETDGYEILVPLHPDGPGGGALTLEVTDGIASCPGMPIDVEPMAAHTGDPMRELVAALARLADELADQYGVDLASLDTTPLDELEPELVPLAVLGEALAALDVDAELATLGADELAVLQGLLATLGLADLLDDLADEIEGLPVGPAPAPAPAFASVEGSSPPPLRSATPREIALAPLAALAATTTSGGCANLGSADPGRFDVSTPDKLAEHLAIARGAADAIGPLQNSISDLNSGFALLGIVPGGGWATAGVGLLWGWGSYAVDLANQMRASLYPSRVTHLTFLVDENRIPEDWDVASDGKIEWNFAKIYSTNEGMNVSRAIVNGTLNVASSTVAVAGAARGFLSTAESFGSAAADVAARDAIDDRLDELPDDPNDCWNIPATQFGPTVVDDDTGEQWVKAQVIGGTAISVDDREITPQEIGSVTLRVETNTENLPGPRGFGDQPVEVARKSVRWLPGTLFVQTIGQEETVRVRFDDTKHFEPEYVLISSEDEISGFSKQDLGGGLYEVKFTTPDDPAKFPVEITAASTSSELPPDTPERSATMLVTTEEEVRIAPREGCVPNGDPLDLTAAFSSVDPTADVDWSITSGGGLLAGSGEMVLYTAPTSGSGAVTIHAQLSTNSDVEDEVTLYYGNCVDVAVFHKVEGNYYLPGSATGCPMTPDDSYTDEFVYDNDNEDGDGKNPETPLTSTWGPGQRATFNEILSTNGVRGFPGANDSCPGGSFPADVRNASTVGVASDGVTVEYDIDLYSRATCDTVAGREPDPCSSTNNAMVVYSVYELEIDAEADYRLEAALTCDGPALGAPTLQVVVFRFNAAGDLVPISGVTNFGIFDTRQCTGGNSTAYNRVVHFDEPAGATPDRAVVQFITVNITAPNPDLPGEEESLATMTGSVRVTEALE